jgi:hypothetical protein
LLCSSQSVHRFTEERDVGRHLDINIELPRFKHVCVIDGISRNH